MATHHLYLTNSVLVSLLAGRGGFTARREFPVTDEGLAEFEAHLRTLARHPTHLHTDLGEEDFRADTIPHVGRGDRETIVARKLGQIFRNAPFRHAIVQGREAEGRRDDRVLYAALTSAEVVKPWLELIERLEVPFEGMHSAALLGTRLLEALDIDHAHTLLVHLSPGDALRQTYFRGHELRLTRLTHVDLQAGQSLGSLLAEETTRTWQYLDNLRSFGPEDRLEVVILAHPRDHETIRPSLEGFQQLGYHLLDSDQVSSKIGLKPPAKGPGAEEVLVHLFERKPIENHFATPDMRRFAVLRTARHAITTAAAGILAIGVVTGGLTLSRIMYTADADARTEREVAELNRQYDQIRRSMPNFDVAGAAMRDAVSFYSGFIQGFPSLPQFVVPLSAALEAHPTVRLNQLAWQATDDAKATPALTPQPSRVPPPAKSFARGAEAAARSPAADEAAGQPFTGGRFEVALVEALVTTPTNDFRGAIAEVEKLAADIGRIKDYRADVVESPLDLRSSLQLQGRNADREPATMEARFVLRVVRTRGAT
jgi:hypothetical protein